VRPQFSHLNSNGTSVGNTTTIGSTHTGISASFRLIAGLQDIRLTVTSESGQVRVCPTQVFPTQKRGESVVVFSPPKKGERVWLYFAHPKKGRECGCILPTQKRGESVVVFSPPKKGERVWLYFPWPPT
jgi:hypothetical protein